MQICMSNDAADTSFFSICICNLYVCESFSISCNVWTLFPLKHWLDAETEVDIKPDFD